MDKKTQNYIIIGVIVLLILIAALFLFYYSGKDNTPANTTPSNTTPSAPSTSGAGPTSTPSTGEGLSGNNTIYANREIGGGSSAQATNIQTIEDLYNVRNNLSGNYKLMNDLDFYNPECYDFSNQDVWDHVAYEWLIYQEIIDSGETGFEDLTEDDWNQVDWIAVKGTDDGGWNGQWEYMRFFSSSHWTPIGSVNLSSISDPSDPEAVIDAAFKNAFNGSFNGNGKIIEFGGGYSPGILLEEVSLYRSRSSGGLFAIIGKTGSVSNVTLMNSNVYEGFLGTGNIANINMGTVSSSFVYSMGGGPKLAAVEDTPLMKKSLSFGSGELVGINSGTIRNSGIYGGRTDSMYGSGGIAGMNLNLNESRFEEMESIAAESEGSSGLAFMVSKGYLSGPATIQNCSVSNSHISGTFGVGGIAGLNAGGIVKQSSVSGTYVSGSDAVGGIVGYSFYGNITDCYYQFQNTYYDGYSIDGSAHVGGIAGSIFNANVSNCYFTGELYGDESNVGGIVGRVEGAEAFVKNNMVADSYIELDSSSNNNTGRIVGFIKGNDAKDNYKEEPEQNYAYKGIEVYCPSTASGNYDGTDKNLSDLYQQATYTTAVSEQWTAWNFNSIWKMDEGPYGLPIFKWQDSSISEYWTVDSGTLTVNGEGVEITEAVIYLWADGSAEFYVNSFDFDGFWMYDTNTSQQDDIIVYFEDYEDGFKAHLDNQGYLIFDNLNFTYSGTVINATGMKLREVPPNEDVWWYWEEMIALNATVSESPISKGDISSISLDLNDDNTYGFSITVTDVGSFETSGGWSINETRLLGDYTFDFEEGLYNARIVRGHGWSYYLIIDTEEFSFIVEDEYPVALIESVIGGNWD
ncbi:GLUG motif-containing protein [Methanolapillus millepedarum]|uniref:GLUG domain-containing protein n=1 Tax=Methanolapillus millepedarum TaxID=3028296 RepID=A0AA96V5G8_9EURY|nr:hypothetical protein MsAc7_09480 [Methanosarcinaceae archaeon Ac7]